MTRPEHRPTAAFSAALALALVATLAACKEDEAEATEVASAQTALEQPAAKAAAETKAPAQPPATPGQVPYVQPPQPFPRTGWHKVSVENRVPICLFPSWEAQSKAQFLKDVPGGEKLKAGKIVVGAFGPWCANEACDGRPSLQCEVKREGHFLRVSSRYWGERKDGAGPCTDGCRPMTAACETPELEKGKYTLVHGDLEAEFRIPGVVDPPCFGGELPQPPP